MQYASAHCTLLIYSCLLVAAGRVASCGKFLSSWLHSANILMFKRSAVVALSLLNWILKFVDKPDPNSSNNLNNKTFSHCLCMTQQSTSFDFTDHFFRILKNVSCLPRCIFIYVTHTNTCTHMFIYEYILFNLTDWWVSCIVCQGNLGRTGHSLSALASQNFATRLSVLLDCVTNWTAPRCWNNMRDFLFILPFPGFFSLQPQQRHATVLCN